MKRSRAVSYLTGGALVAMGLGLIALVDPLLIFAGILIVLGWMIGEGPR